MIHNGGILSFVTLTVIFPTPRNIGLMSCCCAFLAFVEEKLIIPTRYRLYMHNKLHMIQSQYVLLAIYNWWEWNGQPINIFKKTPLFTIYRAYVCIKDMLMVIYIHIYIYFFLCMNRYHWIGHLLYEKHTKTWMRWPRYANGKLLIRYFTSFITKIHV